MKSIQPKNERRNDQRNGISIYISTVLRSRLTSMLAWRPSEAPSTELIAVDGPRANHLGATAFGARHRDHNRYSGAPSAPCRSRPAVTPASCSSPTVSAAVRTCLLSLLLSCLLSEGIAHVLINRYIPYGGARAAYSIQHALGQRPPFLLEDFARLLAFENSPPAQRQRTVACSL